MKVAEAASRYMDDKRGRLRACTLAGYESALALHVLPRWGELELEAITPEGVQGWIDAFDLPGAAEKAYKTLRQVIRWAIRRLGVRMYDPTAAGVELPHKPAHRPRTMEASQVRAYLRALWGHECEAVAICSVTLGLRRGEACGLKWSDIDLRTGEVRIRRSRQVVRGNEVVEAPKTERSARSCWLPRFAIKRLRALRKGRSGWLCELSPDAIARQRQSLDARKPKQHLCLLHWLMGHRRFFPCLVGMRADAKGVWLLPSSANKIAYRDVLSLLYIRNSAADSVN